MCSSDLEAIQHMTVYQATDIFCGSEIKGPIPLGDHIQIDAQPVETVIIQVQAQRLLPGV